MTDSPHQIDYAPPRRRPGWLTGRAAALAVVVVAAALAAWVVVPRVWHRGEVLRAQESILENRAALPAGELVSDLTWMGSRPGMMLFDTRVPELEAFANWALGQPLRRAAFFGGRKATDNSPQRIVIVTASEQIFGTRQPPQITLIAYVFEPGTWTSAPLLLHQSATGPLPLPVPPESGWRLAVLPGRAAPESPARFQIELEGGYARTPDTRRLTITGHLLPDDTIRFEWPTESHPVPPAAAASQPAA